MKSRYFTYGVTVAAMLATVLLVFVSAPNAQQANSSRVDSFDSRPTPKMADGHPDFSGFWMNGVAGLRDYSSAEKSTDGNLTRLPDGSLVFLYDGGLAGVPNDGKIDRSIPANAPPYKPEYMAKVQEIDASIYGWNTSSPLDPMNECKPNGVTRLEISGSQIIMNPAGVAVMFENGPGPVYRVIYTDGRPHPTDLDTSYMGHSIGHWDGDTLVIDTVGLNDETWLGTGKLQLIHSDKLHVVEHWSRKGDVMTRTVTVEDPVMFTKPWTYGPEKTTIANKGDYIQPEMCRTNDKAHLILQTPNNVWRCNWCQIDADKVYGEGAATDNKTNANRGGGGE